MKKQSFNYGIEDFECILRVVLEKFLDKDKIESDIQKAKRAFKDYEQEKNIKKQLQIHQEIELQKEFIEAKEQYLELIKKMLIIHS